MGTAGCISMIKDDFSNLVVINGDIISNVDIKSLLTYHNDTKNDITLTVAKYSYKVPFGLVELDKNQHLKYIREKPSVDYDVISGIYCIRKNICDTINHEHLDMTTLISNSIKLNFGIMIGNIIPLENSLGLSVSLCQGMIDFGIKE